VHFLNTSVHNIPRVSAVIAKKDVKDKDRYTKDQLFLHASSKTLFETTKWTESTRIHIYLAVPIKKTSHLLKQRHKQLTTTYKKLRLQISTM